MVQLGEGAAAKAKNPQRESAPDTAAGSVKSIDQLMMIGGLMEERAGR